MKGWSPYSEQWFSNCVPQTSGISITCKAIRNAMSPTSWVRTSGWGRVLCASTAQASLGIRRRSLALWLTCCVSFPS